MASLFIGLGPRGEISEADLRKRLEEVCTIRELRMRGSFAFVDVETRADADALIQRLSGCRIQNSTLSVQLSRPDAISRKRRRDSRSRSRSRERYMRRERSRSRERYMRRERSRSLDDDWRRRQSFSSDRSPRYDDRRRPWDAYDHRY